GSIRCPPVTHLARLPASASPLCTGCPETGPAAIAAARRLLRWPMSRVGQSCESAPRLILLPPPGAQVGSSGRSRDEIVGLQNYLIMSTGHIMKPQASCHQKT
ncbi:unnamed protein product, partial [Nesidiocoris tenuis]